MANILNNALVINDTANDLNYSKSIFNNNFSYKVSLSELLDLFKKDHESIYAYDTCNCLTFITDDDKEMTLFEYQNYPDKHKVIFCRITNYDMFKAKSDIIISLADNQMVSVRNYPLVSNEEIPDVKGGYSYIKFMDEMPRLKTEAKSDLNGYENTLSLLDVDKNYISDNSVSALKYCQSKSMETVKYIYTGYIPAYGQLYILNETKFLLEYILAETKNFVNHLLWKTWTSTSVFVSGAQMYTMFYHDLKYTDTAKLVPILPNGKGCVYPLFKQILKN